MYYNHRLCTTISIWVFFPIIQSSYIKHSAMSVSRKRKTWWSTIIDKYDPWPQRTRALGNAVRISVTNSPLTGVPKLYLWIRHWMCKRWLNHGYSPNFSSTFSSRISKPIVTLLWKHWADLNSDHNFKLKKKESVINQDSPFVKECFKSIYN